MIEIIPRWFWILDEYKILRFLIYNFTFPELVMSFETTNKITIYIKVHGNVGDKIWNIVRSLYLRIVVYIFRWA